jgi:hypothetical protein
MTGQACCHSKGRTGAVRRSCRRASSSMAYGWLELLAVSRCGCGKGRVRRRWEDFTTGPGIRYHMVPSLRYRVVPKSRPQYG